MAFIHHNDDDHKCRFCQHHLGSHTAINGCNECACLASKGEARER